MTGFADDSTGMSTQLVSGLLVALDLVLVLTVTIHVLLHKHDPRSMIGWIAICLLIPFIGALLYYLFGINRVQTRARRLAARSPFQAGIRQRPTPPPHPACLGDKQQALADIGRRITGQALQIGNRLHCLYNGEQAYPAMLASIATARRSVYLSSYIFDTNPTGRTFIRALHNAYRRGLDVRVLVDGIGELNSWPRASRLLQRRSVPVARFIPPRLFPPQVSINLRNHRKILVVDSEIAYTGGMNISHHHLAAAHRNPERITDLHFRLTGPIVQSIQQTFLEDWGFVTGDRRPVHEPLPTPQGEACCRAIIDGPNEDMDRLIQVLTAVICAARHRIGIMTPYFLPPNELLAVLRAAALRGVAVTVLLPGHIDHAFVHWAANNILGLLLRDGVRIMHQPPPFAHGKLLLIDDNYLLLGSANLDPRSLRLNFEFNVEVFDRPLAEELWRHFEQLTARSTPVTREALQQRSTAVRLRDALAWACSPYL